MNQEFLNEAKNFRMQMKWSSIICWIGSAIFAYGWFTGNKGVREDFTWMIIPIGGIILSGIYFSMNKNIKKYEQLNK